MLTVVDCAADSIGDGNVSDVAARRQKFSQNRSTLETFIRSNLDVTLRYVRSSIAKSTEHQQPHNYTEAD